MAPQKWSVSVWVRIKTKKPDGTLKQRHTHTVDGRNLAPKNRWFLMIPLWIPTNNGFNHGFQASVAFCSPANSLTLSGLIDNPLVGNKLTSQHPSKMQPADDSPVNTNKQRFQPWFPSGANGIRSQLQWLSGFTAHCFGFSASRRLKNTAALQNRAGHLAATLFVRHFSWDALGFHSNKAHGHGCKARLAPSEHPNPH